jgi:hypothetical protein
VYMQIVEYGRSRSETAAANVSNNNTIRPKKE